MYRAPVKSQPALASLSACRRELFLFLYHRYFVIFIVNSALFYRLIGIFFLSVNNDFLLRCGVKGLIYDLIFRVAALTTLPRAVIEESEELQVGTYK